jgi:type IV pilus assembly protein PilB
MPISEKMRTRILEGDNTMQLAEQAALEGVNDLRRSGLLKVMQGVTSIEEIDRVTREGSVARVIGSEEHLSKK